MGSKKQTEAAPKAKPSPKHTTGLDPNARTVAIVEAKKDQSAKSGSIYIQGSLLSNLSKSEIDRRMAWYKETRGYNKYKYTYQTDAFTKMMKKRRISPPGMGCKSDFEVFIPSKKKALLPRGVRTLWSNLCNRDRLDDIIKFTERKYQNQENEFRVFIEGAEVTAYVEGSLSWTIEATGGVNTCRFVLNNTQDAFIVTPTNVCAGPYNVGAWRINYSRRKKTVYTGATRTNWRVDEVAKWQIYKRKYEAVNPDGELKQIDSFNGMWLYPLNPFSCIFNRNDAVRVFVRIPHVAGVWNKKTKNWYDLWMPAFTGFIDKYSWTDSPLEGRRTVSVTCYDYRGLMERMRVRVHANPVTTTDDKNRKPPGTGKPDKQKGKPGKDPSTDGSRKASPSKRGTAFLKRAMQVGASFEKSNQRFYRAFKSSKPHSNNANSYEYGKLNFFLESTYVDLHTLWVAKLASGAGNAPACKGTRGEFDIRRGHLAKAGSDFGVPCAVGVVSKVDSAVSRIAVDVTKSLGLGMADMMTIYDLIGESYIIQADARRVIKSTVTGENIAIVLNVLPLKTNNLDKDSSLKTIFGDTYNALNKPMDGEKLSTAQKFTKDVAIYYSARAYAALAAQYKASTGTGAVSAAAQNEVVSGWVLWCTYAVHNSLIDIGVASSIRIQGPKATVVEYEKRLRGHVDYVNSWLLKKQNPLLGADAKPKLYNTGKVAKQLNLKYEQKAKIEKQLETTTNKKLRNKILLILKEVNAEIKTLKRKVDSTATGNASSTWRQLLQFEKDPTPNRTVEQKFSLNDFSINADSHKTAELGLNAYSKGLELCRPLIADWGASYMTAQNRCKVLAQSLVTRLEARFKTTKTSVSGEYPAYVASSAALGGGGVNIGEALLWMDWKREQLKKTIKGGSSFSTHMNIRRWIDEVRNFNEKGERQITRAKTRADALVKFAEFETTQAGMFGDLVSNVELEPHPLIGKSLEQSIEYLCCEQQNINKGVITEISNYMDKTNTAKEFKGRFGKTLLDKWNRVVLFGILGRPLTYPEVTLIGEATTSDYRSAFSPYNVFYHLIKPAGGTGASTIIQQNTGETTINSLNVVYETRKKLLDDCCSVLDYQYWVSGWGDFIFEFPHYNAFPRDFGIISHQAYKLVRDWKSATISEEAIDVPTAWVITGKNVNKKTEKPTSSKLNQNYFKTVVIMAPVLARRIGVRVENINLKIPGLGGAGDIEKGKGKTTLALRNQQALEQLNIYGLFHIQRQLGRAHSMQVTMPFRPYIVPNRPIWLIPRQRIGLVKSVTHTMNPPMGECTTETNLNYTRWLFRDGTFRFSAGGPRQPISYIGFFTGIPPRDNKGNIIPPKEGTKNEGKATSRSNTGQACTGALMTAAASASAFSVAVASQWGDAYATPASIRRSSASPYTVVDIETAGYRPSVSMSSDTPPKLKQTYATRATRADPLAYMKDVWKSIPRGKGGYESFGYLRRWQMWGQGAYVDWSMIKPKSHKNYKRPSRGDYIHRGWDLPAGVGAPCMTPFDVLKASAYLMVGRWGSAKSRLAWAKIGNGVYSKSTLKRFAVSGAASTAGYILIYAVPFIMYKNLGGRKSGLRLKRGHYRSGLVLEIEGEAAVPKLENGGVVWAELAYVHISDIKRINGTILGGKGNKTGSKNSPLAKAGDTICWAGASGADGAHLHLGMRIKNLVYGGATGEEALRITIAANKNFIDAQLRARAGAYKRFDGTDPREDLPKLNAPAAAWWQGYWRKRALRRGLRKSFSKKKVTVGDVVAYYQKRNTYKEFYPGEKNIGRGGWIRVHPGFFFEVWQIVKQNLSQGEYRGFRAVYGEYKQEYMSVTQGANRALVGKGTLCARINTKSISRKGTLACRTKYGVYEVNGQLACSGNSCTAQSREKYMKCISDVNNQVKAIKQGKLIMDSTPVGSNQWKTGKARILAQSLAQKWVNKEYKAMARYGSKEIRRQLGKSFKGDLVPAY